MFICVLSVQKIMSENLCYSRNSKNFKSSLVIIKTKEIRELSLLKIVTETAMRRSTNI